MPYKQLRAAFWIHAILIAVVLWFLIYSLMDVDSGRTRHDDDWVSLLSFWLAPILLTNPLWLGALLLGNRRWWAVSLRWIACGEIVWISIVSFDGFVAPTIDRLSHHTKYGPMIFDWPLLYLFMALPLTGVLLILSELAYAVERLLRAKHE